MKNFNLSSKGLSMSDNDEVFTINENVPQNIQQFEPVPFEKLSKEEQLIFLQEKISCLNKSLHTEYSVMSNVNRSLANQLFFQSQYIGHLAATNNNLNAKNYLQTSKYDEKIRELNQLLEESKLELEKNKYKENNLKEELRNKKRKKLEQKLKKIETEYEMLVKEKNQIQSSQTSITNTRKEERIELGDSSNQSSETKPKKPLNNKTEPAPKQFVKSTLLKPAEQSNVASGNGNMSSQANLTHKSRRHYKKKSEATALIPQPIQSTEEKRKKIKHNNSNGYSLIKASIYFLLSIFGLFFLYQLIIAKKTTRAVSTKEQEMRNDRIIKEGENILRTLFKHVRFKNDSRKKIILLTEAHHYPLTPVLAAIEYQSASQGAPAKEVICIDRRDGIKINHIKSTVEQNQAGFHNGIMKVLHDEKEGLCLEKFNKRICFWSDERTVDLKQTSIQEEFIQDLNKYCELKSSY